MKDPILSFDTIKENFIRYVKTAFGTKFSGFENERYRLLNTDRVLYREPWIEILPDYLSSGKGIDDLNTNDLGNALDQRQVNIFKGLVKTGLFPAAGKLHSHQALMLKEALTGNNCVITSGTGSGKTESFLLPLFAQICKELSTWSVPGVKSPNADNWWNELTPSRIVDQRNNYKLLANTNQRSHYTRPEGVRALILYPMNALVEDQMSRLRKALDSDDTRTWINQNTNGNLIFFGRYNGSSPIAGELKRTDENGTHINTNKVNELKERLQQVEIDANRVEQYIRTNNIPFAAAKELRSFFQRLDGAEMRCRFDMQIAPPDILITNYSMLSIMLMREVDAGIFEKTKSWLACEGLPLEKRESERPNRIFHLIIDELHLYRGTQGTEVAYLLKLVLNRLGLDPHHPQLRILASSASLEPGDQNSQKFLEDFFGIDSSKKPFKIITGESVHVERFSTTEPKLPLDAFANIAVAYDSVGGRIGDTAFAQTCEECANTLENTFRLQGAIGGGIEKLLRVLLMPEIRLRERLYTACEVDGSHRAVCSIQANGDVETGHFIADAIFNHTGDRNVLRRALRGLLIARALFDEQPFRLIESSSSSYKLPRLRFHYFFRNIEGVWASVKPDDIDQEFADGERTAGRLYPTTRIKSENGFRVLELLYCDNCGTTLFGGSRLAGVNRSFELLPLSPNIEGIPEKTPARLVEKRSYQEFGIFWPLGGQSFVPHDTPRGYWRQTTINGFNQRDFDAQWEQASLNVLSGDVHFTFEKATAEPGRWLKGHVFIVRDNNGHDVANMRNPEGNMIETHKATPCVCPACGVNHQKRQNASLKSKITSIRGFRTGFAKTTQMFAKELMYQLPEERAERKLVVFSDSREDAAQVANGIERNHFTDLMREILVSELHSNLLLGFNITNAFDSGDEMRKNEFRNTGREMYDKIENLFEKSQYQGVNITAQREKDDAIQKLNQFRSRVVNVREMVALTNSINLAPLIRHFIELGINPGGNDISLQSRLLNNQFVPWYSLIDFVNAQWADGADQTFINDIIKGAFSNLSSIFFGTLFYSFESSALGYLSINPELEIIRTESSALQIPQDQFLQIINSTIRILGDKYKHNYNEDSDPFNLFSYVDFPAQVKRFIRSVATRYSANENALGASVFDVLSSSGLLNAEKGILLEKLFIKIALADDPVWISPRGNRPHLHFSGGICTYSLATLSERYDKLCRNIWENNYLSYNAIIEKRPPIRLHCEELTGQTDNQFVRQRHFRNIILPEEGQQVVKNIDLLSVTTTLEVGVDIGALQAVMLGNMPPQRFNYQQRVGRAGRRGQAYSIVFTFCRGRSHDEFYFSNPDKITGDPPPTPFLTMGQPRIFRRLLSKEILRRAFLTVPKNVNNDEDKSSVHGEFGKVDNWPAYKLQLEEWIRSNRPEVEDVVQALITPDLLPYQQQAIDWVFNVQENDSLIARADSIMQNEEIATDDVSEKLAEGGILPMFGMPTTVKNLYHGISTHLEPRSIDRPQAISIYEFAPGAQKTKDKTIHTVVGFTSNLIKIRRGGAEIMTNANTPNNSPFSLNRWMVRCKSCGFNQTYGESNEPVGTTCPNCGNQNTTSFAKFKIKTPRSYRTDFSLGQDLKDDSELLLSRPPIFAERIDDPSNPDLNKRVGNAQLILSDKDVTWRINTNSDRFYTGRTYNVVNGFPFTPQGYRFQNQWILNDLANPVINTNGHWMQLSGPGTDEQIALASNKKTEVFRLSPQTIPWELDLNMFAGDLEPMFIKAQSYGVRSAFYSAAFLLQRILADRLDVDPTEIEIADITLKRLEDGTDRKTAEIILTDELPNGSGFVRYLYDNFENIIQETLAPTNAQSYLGRIHSVSHQRNCKDACYDCLKVYRNMNYHSLLDWRLGVGLLRLMNNGEYSAGADRNFKTCFEISEWLEFATQLRDNFIESFPEKFPRNGRAEMNGLPVITWGARQRNMVIIIHPFWDLRNMSVENWLTESKMEIDEYVRRSGGKLSIVDSFNLHRRPGWCYEYLVNRI